MMDKEKRIEELRTALPLLEKVIKSLIFKGVDVEHEFHVAENSNIPYILLQFYIDIDKQYKGSPTYDKEYKKTVDEIEHKINDVLRYVGLSPMGPYVVQHYTYVNDEYVQEVVKNCHDELINILTMEYKIPYHLIQEYDILVQLQENPDYPSDTNIMAYSSPLSQGWGTDSGFMDRGIDCDKLIEIVDKVFETIGVIESGFPYHNFICEKNPL
jgi:hypothetical protein